MHCTHLLSLLARQRAIVAWELYRPAAAVGIRAEILSLTTRQCTYLLLRMGPARILRQKSRTVLSQNTACMYYSIHYTTSSTYASTFADRNIFADITTAGNRLRIQLGIIAVYHYNVKFIRQTTNIQNKHRTSRISCRWS